MFIKCHNVNEFLKNIYLGANSVKNTWKLINTYLSNPNFEQHSEPTYECFQHEPVLVRELLEAVPHGVPRGYGRVPEPTAARVLVEVLARVGARVHGAQD